MAVKISTHTLRGERDLSSYLFPFLPFISTHTLRGERDDSTTESPVVVYKFQLTRSVGSVTNLSADFFRRYENFNSHAPWGA